MGRQPIDILLDSLEWKSLPPMDEQHDGLPHATHYGVLDIVGHKIRCYQLSDGQRIFDADDVARFFGEKK